MIAARSHSSESRPNSIVADIIPTHAVILTHTVILRSEATKNLLLTSRAVGDSSLPPVAQNDRWCAVLLAD
jgi:hypothetical protein